MRFPNEPRPGSGVFQAPILLASLVGVGPTLAKILAAELQAMMVLLTCGLIDSCGFLFRFVRFLVFGRQVTKDADARWRVEGMLNNHGRKYKGPYFSIYNIVEKSHMKPPRQYGIMLPDQALRCGHIKWRMII
jgi:hypothetical protein